MRQRLNVARATAANRRGNPQTEAAAETQEPSTPSVPLTKREKQLAALALGRAKAKSNKAAKKT